MVGHLHWAKLQFRGIAAKIFAMENPLVEIINFLLKWLPCSGLVYLEQFG